MIEKNDLKGTFAYIDNVTIGGMTKEEHDKNSRLFEEICRERNITLNESKITKDARVINILGYQVGNGMVAPEPERLMPLREMRPPSTAKELKRVRGLFAYYAKWIRDFSTKIKPLASVSSFLISKSATLAFNNLKKEVEKVSMTE